MDKAKEGLQLEIVKNVNALMKERDIKQAAIAEATGIAQSNLSKCLSYTGVNNVSIDNLVKIADFFQVSVDHLLGRDKKEVTGDPQSSEDICRNLMNLIETETVNIVSREVEEDAYVPNTSDLECYTYPYQYEKAKNTYRMFYFSNYEPLPDMTNMSGVEIDDIEQELAICGSYYPKGVEVNAFIEFYLKLRDLYKNNDLSRDFFRQAVEDRLNQMRY